MINRFKKVIFVFFVVKMLLLVAFASQAFTMIELNLCTFYLNTAVSNGELVDSDGDGIYGFSAAGEALSDQVKTSYKNCCLLYASDNGPSTALECLDNCASSSNADQVDTDGDGVGDVCDNCPNDANSDQANMDDDAAGNVCDVDECSTTEAPPPAEIQKCDDGASMCETSVPVCKKVGTKYQWWCDPTFIEDCCENDTVAPNNVIDNCKLEKGEECFSISCSSETKQWECGVQPGCDECDPKDSPPAEKITECKNQITPGQCEKNDPVCIQDVNGIYKWDCIEDVIDDCCTFTEVPPPGFVQACSTKEGPCYELTCDAATQQWSCGKGPGCEEPTEDECMIGAHGYPINAPAPLAKAEEVCGKKAIDCRQPTAICRTGGTWMCTGAVTVPGCEEPTEDVCMFGTTKYNINDAAPLSKAKEVCPPTSSICEVPIAKCTDNGWRCTGADTAGCEACTEGDKLNDCPLLMTGADFEYDEKEGAWVSTFKEMLQKLENAVVDPEIYKLIDNGKITDPTLAPCFSCEQVCDEKGVWIAHLEFDEEKCAPPKEEGLCKPIIHPEWFNVDKKADLDGDGVPNMCDNCVNIFNPGQLDDNHDNVGNACDDDEKCMSPCCGASCCCSGPGCPASVAECPLAVGAEIGHPVMDPDGDSRRNDLKDKSGRPCDNCPTAANPYQDDWDLDTVGNACDNCTFVPNLTQKEAFDGACKDADFASNNVACGASCPAATQETPPTIAAESKEEIPAENAEECTAAGGEWLFFDPSGDLVTESDIAAMIAKGESVQAKCVAAARFSGEGCKCSFAEHSTWNTSAINRLLLISLFFAVPTFWLRRRLVAVKVKRK